MEKYFNNYSNGFQPNNGFYRMNDQIAEPSGRVETTLEKLDAPQDAANSLGGSVEQRTQRFGITAYGGNGIQVKILIPILESSHYTIFLLTSDYFREHIHRVVAYPDCTVR